MHLRKRLVVLPKCLDKRTGSRFSIQHSIHSVRPTDSSQMSRRREPDKELVFHQPPREAFCEVHASEEAPRTAAAWAACGRRVALSTFRRADTMS